MQSNLINTRNTRWGPDSQSSYFMVFLTPSNLSGAAFYDWQIVFGCKLNSESQKCPRSVPYNWLLMDLLFADIRSIISLKLLKLHSIFLVMQVSRWIFKLLAKQSLKFMQLCHAFRISLETQLNSAQHFCPKYFLSICVKKVVRKGIGIQNHQIIDLLFSTLPILRGKCKMIRWSTVHIFYLTITILSSRSTFILQG